MSTKLRRTEEKIRKLKQRLVEIGPLRPGSLTLQKRQSSKRAYGQYWHLSYTHAGKGHTEYVPTAHLKVITQEVKNYRVFRATLDRFIAASIELSTLKLKSVKDGF